MKADAFGAKFRVNHVDVVALEMASLGHSGSQAPQLMQSWVIFVAMGLGVLMPLRLSAAGKYSEGCPGGVNRRQLFGGFRAQIVRERGRVRRDHEISRLTLGILAAALLGVASGCGRDIGAACTASINCSQMGDRVCDTSMPGGYCSVFSCEPDTCPTEAACIAFRQWPSAVSACEDPSDTRMLRTFCMVYPRPPLGERLAHLLELLAHPPAPMPSATNRR